MEIRQLNLKQQLTSIREELIQALIEVVDSTQYILGPQIGLLEKRVSEYIGVKHGIGVSSGTDALLVSLMALNIEAGDIVITTPYSFFATAGVVARLRARPVFADIAPETYNIDPAAVHRALEGLSEEERKKVKALLPVHLYGQTAEMEPLMEIAKEYGIPVIEDCAQAIGARYSLNGREVKAGAMGLAGCFSFFPTKNLGGLGDGGMVVTDDDEFAEQVRLLRVHGAKSRYYHYQVGGNFRLDTLQAAALLVKLPHLEEWHTARQRAAEYYDEELASVSQVKRPQIAYRREYHIFNQYVIAVPDRDGLMERMNEKGISCAIYYPVPFHLQPCFTYLGYRKGDFPVSESAAESTLALPIYPELPRGQQDYVVEVIDEYYRT